MSGTHERRRILRAKYQNPTPALFLDRDGVLIEDRHHLYDPSKVRLCPGSKELVETAYEKNWAVIVVTNQSGISRGYFSWYDYERVTDQLLKLLGVSAPLAGIYANGHAPDAPAASWRKPSPAMLLEASRELNLDLKKSILVGDRLSDMKAGAQAGVDTLIHVLTGHGLSERAVIKAWVEKQKGDPPSKNHEIGVVFMDTLVAFPNSLISNHT